MKTRLPLLALVLAATGCVDNNASIQMVGVCAIPTTGCAFSSGKCSAYEGGQFVYDVVSGTADMDGWNLPVEVKNQVAKGGDGKVSVNTNDALVTEVVAEFDTLGAVVVDNTAGTVAPLSIPASSERLAQGVPAAGSSVLFLSPISFGLSQYLAGVLPSDGTLYPVIARTRLKGRYDNGSLFETGEFEIPVKLCAGCIAAPVCTSPSIPAGCPGTGQTPGTSGCNP